MAARELGTTKVTKRNHERSRPELIHKQFAIRTATAYHYQGRLMLRIGMRKGTNMRTSISRGVIVVATLCVALSSAVALAEDNGAATNSRPAPRADSAPRPSSAAPAAAPAAPSARGKATFYKPAPPRYPAKSALPHPAGQPNPGSTHFPGQAGNPASTVRLYDRSEINAARRWARSATCICGRTKIGVARRYP